MHVVGHGAIAEYFVLIGRRLHGGSVSEGLANIKRNGNQVRKLTAA
jgi:hypothetical protein